MPSRHSTGVSIVLGPQAMDQAAPLLEDKGVRQNRRARRTIRKLRTNNRAGTRRLSHSQEEVPAMHPNATRIAIVFSMLGLMVLMPILAIAL